MLENVGDAKLALEHTSKHFRYVYSNHTHGTVLYQLGEQSHSPPLELQHFSAAIFLSQVAI